MALRTRTLLVASSRPRIALNLHPGVGWTSRSLATGEGAKDPLVTALQTGLKAAMREKDKFRSQVLKSALSDIQAMQHHEKPPPAVQTLLSALSKRKEALKIYTSQNNEEGIEQYTKEIRILEELVPEDARELTLDQLTAMVQEVMQELGIAKGADVRTGLSKVIKEVKARAGLRASNLGKELADTVKKALS